MHHFAYKSGVLCAEDVLIPDMAEDVGTPFYCYSSATFVRHYDVLADALRGLDSMICYSVKANSNIAVLKTLAARGAGADVVSQGELHRALAAGSAPERIVCSGLGKTADEMRFALDTGIYQFNVESLPELETLDAVAREAGTRAPVTMRINPDVDARTHAKISTGKREDKFGLPWTQARELYAMAGDMPGIEIVGIDVHIGSQLTELEPFEAAFGRVAELVGILRADGHRIDRVDLGGGLGIPYLPDDPEPPHPEEYAAMIARLVGALSCQVILEPGRLIAGNAGILVTRVIYVKQAENRTFVILDGAMNDLLRPSLYDAYHHILPVDEPAEGANSQVVDFVGPICETGDTFATDRVSPPLGEGDLVAIMSAGAYGAVMSSTYNTRLLVPEVLVDGARYAVVRRRPSYDEMLSQETIPDWLQ